MQKYHSPVEVAELFGVELEEVSSWMDYGELRAVRFGSVFRVLKMSSNYS